MMSGLSRNLNKPLNEEVNIVTDHFTLKDVYEMLNITFIPDYLSRIPIDKLSEMTPDQAKQIRRQFGCGWINDEFKDVPELDDFKYSRHEFRTRDDGSKELVIYIPLKPEGF